MVTRQRTKFMRLFVWSLLTAIILSVIGCGPDDGPKQKTDTYRNSIVTMDYSNGLALATFKFVQTTDESDSTVDLQIQNLTSCTLSFPYRIQVSLNYVNYEVQGAVSNLQPWTATSIEAISNNPIRIDLSTINIEIGQITRTDCGGGPLFAGLWSGYYTASSNYANGYLGQSGELFLNIDSNGIATFDFMRLDNNGIPDGYRTFAQGTIDQNGVVSAGGIDSRGSFNITGQISEISTDSYGRRQLTFNLLQSYGGIYQIPITGTGVYSTQ